MRAESGRRRYYDEVHYSAEEVAARAERKLSVSDPWYRLINDFLARQDYDVAGRRVLEVGCGLGGFCLHLTGAGARVIGVDFSTSAALAAHGLALEQGSGPPPPTYAVADARRLPFADRSFDLVVCAETLEHTFDLEGSVREIARVCAPGGLVALTVPNSLLGLPVDLAVTALGIGQPQVPVNFFRLRRAATLAGLNLLDAYGTNFARNMYSEDVLPPIYRKVTERVGAVVEKGLSRRNPMWIAAAGTVGVLLTRPLPASTS